MKIDVSNLTCEELIQYIASLENANGELGNELEKANQTIDLVTKENAKLEQKFEKLQIKYNKLFKKVEAKTAIIKVINHNKFYTKKESAEEPIVFGEADKIVKKKGCKEGSKNF